jgi:hypothetical protein
MAQVIHEASPNKCWDAFVDRISEYWGRLQAAGSANGVVAGWPETRPTERNGKLVGGELVLGGESAFKHEPMATPAEVRELFARVRGEAVLVGSPASAAVLGFQRVVADEVDGGRFALRTTSYKYTLVAGTRDDDAPGGLTWFAVRLESEPHAGEQSWLLNHPIHHYQLGGSGDLRVLSPRGRSLTSFVDMILRAFAPDTWGELYSALHLELTQQAGGFEWLTRAPQKGEENRLILDGDERRLRDLLRGGRANRLDWHVDMEQWREDIDDRSTCTPELFSLFCDGPVGDP